MDNSRYKFRAWDGKVMHDKITLDDEGRGIKHGYQWFSEGNTLLHSPIMQYTGLKDKKGNEIYHMYGANFTEVIGNIYETETEK